MRMETREAVRHPAAHRHVEAVATIVRSHRLAAANRSQDFGGGSVAIARLPRKHPGQAMFISGGAVPDAMQQVTLLLPRVADLRYIDEVAQAAHGVDAHLDLAWSTWSPDEHGTRRWLAEDEALREALRVAAPRAVTIGRRLPRDPLDEQRPSGQQGRALRAITALEVFGDGLLVVSSGSATRAADAAEAFITLLRSAESRRARG